jgi:hypothetical protein
MDHVILENWEWLVARTNQLLIVRRTLMYIPLVHYSTLHGPTDRGCQLSNFADDRLNLRNPSVLYIRRDDLIFPVTPIIHQRSCSDRFPQAMQLLLTIADCHVTSEYKLDIGHTEVRYSTGNHNFPIVSMTLSTLAAIFRLWFCHPRFELQQLHVYHHGIFYWSQTWLKCFEKQVQAHKRNHTFSHYEASFDVFNTPSMYPYSESLPQIFATFFSHKSRTLHVLSTFWNLHHFCWSHFVSFDCCFCWVLSTYLSVY